MWQLIVEGALLGADFIYHRYLEDHPQPRHALSELSIPRTDVGAPVPLIYGKVRVRAPILMWRGNPVVGGSALPSSDGVTVMTIYGLDMFFTLGIPFPVDEGGIVKVHGMWAGERRLGWIDAANGGLGQSGAGGFEAKIEIGSNAFEGLYIQGEGQWLDGRPTQQLVDGSGAATCWVGQNMLDNGTARDRIVGYRGYLSMHLFQSFSGFVVGTAPSVEAYSFEASSYVSSLDASRWPATYIYSIIGEDSNPMNALYDLCVGYFGKLGLDASVIDMATFQTAGHTLAQEGHGYSRAIETTKPARDHILELLIQIDGALYIDPVTGKVGIQLIRNDYDPATIPVINRSNCKGLRNLAMGGWKGLPTMVRVKYTNRAKDYRDDTADSSSLAGAVGQSGERNPEIVEMPGITTEPLAKDVAERELSARARPLIKCTALMDRSAYRWKQGDAVRMYWDKPGISGIVFRVANINHGTLRNGTIEVDLIQDYYYVQGNNPPVHVPFGGHTVDVGPLSGG